LKPEGKKATAVPAKAPSAPSVRKTGKSKKNLYIVGGIIVVAIIVIVVVALSL
jgi:t-SNARE complex subunit (syntaxin)